MRNAKEYLEREVQNHLADAKRIVARADAQSRDLTASEKSKVEDLLKRTEGKKERIAEIDGDRKSLQHAVEGGLFQGPAPSDFSQKFQASFDAAVRRYAETKDASFTGDLSLPASSPRVETPTEPTIAGLLAQADLDDTDKFSYLKEGVAVIGAAPVAKGAPKPPSDVAISREEGQAETIAHIVDAINQADLDDERFLRDLINKIGREGLLAELDDQILNGNGISPNLTGILDDGDVQSTPAAADMLTTLREAKKDLRLVNEVPTAVLMHPSDAALIDELRDDEVFLIGGAGSPDAPWGVRRVESTKVDEGTALMGNFQKARLYTRSGIRILEDPYAGLAGDNYARNKVDFRFEMRAGVAVLRGQAFTIVTFGS